MLNKINKEIGTDVLILGVLFVVLASPKMFKIMDKTLTFLPPITKAECECPTNFGLVLHGLVFAIVAYLMATMK